MNRTSLILLVLSLGSFACPKAADTTDSGSTDGGTTTETQPAPVTDTTPADAEAAGLDPKWPTLRLNGELTSVRWSDGDSFKFKSGPHSGKGVRLVGYNTLESYGPVHRWGDWSAVELYRIAKSSWKLGAERTWNCTTTGDEDHYGRVLVDCPDAALHIVSAGHAVVFAMDETPSPELLKAQKLAMKTKAGMWAKGAPKKLVSSLHSVDEGEEKAPTYNRVVDTTTGAATEAPHKDTYSTCQEVCIGGDEGSCMTYVPFAIRYKNKPECLIVKEKR